VLIFWKIDRLSRSLSDLLLILDKVSKAGATFRSLTEPLDTTSALGKMHMQLIGVFAEFERAMIHERTMAGLRRAWASGKRSGGRFKRMRLTNYTADHVKPVHLPDFYTGVHTPGGFE
jgi:DNA invertase Pin-like site-specific DNA recombinase